MRLRNVRELGDPGGAKRAASVEGAGTVAFPALPESRSTRRG